LKLLTSNPNSISTFTATVVAPTVAASYDWFSFGSLMVQYGQPRSVAHAKSQKGATNLWSILGNIVHWDFLPCFVICSPSR